MPFGIRQQKWLPLGVNPQTCVQDTAASHPGIAFPELGKVSEHQFHYMQPPLQALLSSYDQQSCEKQVSFLDGAAPGRALKSSQKRFLIFDQSGNQTRLLQCGFPLRFPSSVAAEPGKILDSLNPEKGFSKDYAGPAKMLLHEDHISGQEESEMHEDTEEINALLYSDDGDDDGGCESDDDEVMSTGQSPFPVEQQACNKTTEELAESESSDDGPCRKRRKLLDHLHRDQSPSFVGIITKHKALSDQKLLESNSTSKQEAGSSLIEEQSRKNKIHTAFRILESVVPGAKGKEALLLLDEAIDYLKLLKSNLNSSVGLNNHW